MPKVNSCTPKPTKEFITWLEQAKQNGQVVKIDMKQHNKELKGK